MQNTMALMTALPSLEFAPEICEPQAAPLYQLYPVTYLFGPIATANSTAATAHHGMFVAGGGTQIRCRRGLVQARMPREALWSTGRVVSGGAPETFLVLVSLLQTRHTKQSEDKSPTIRQQEHFVSLANQIDQTRALSISLYSLSCTHLVDVLLEDGRLIRGLRSIQILLRQQLLDVVLFLLQNLLSTRNQSAANLH